MNEMPFFSILIPVYNREGKMNISIESLLAQTFGDFEAVMVDDGSTDGSAEALVKLGEKDPRFRAVFHGNNRSVMAARYTAMSEASGQYILFLDSDDYLDENALELLHAELSEKPVDVLMFGAVFEPKGDRLGPGLTVDPLRSGLEGILPPNVWKNCYSSRVIRKSLERISPFYCNMSEDNFLSAVFFSCAESFASLDEYLYHYIVGEGMSTTKTDLSLEKLKKDISSVKAAGEHLMEYIRSYEPAYADLAYRTSRRMLKFVLFQHIYFEEDWTKVFFYMNFFNCEEYKDIFEFGCSCLFPNKIKRSLGVNVGRFSFD